MLFRDNKKLGIYSPIEGSFVSLCEINDSTFSSGIMGTGFGIYPEGDFILSPINGEITMIFPTKHAIGVTRSDGLEMLIHIGIDTVSLKGEGFKILVSNKSKIKTGQKLVHFDREVILKNGFDPIVIVIFTNDKKYDVTINQEKLELNRKELIGYAKKR